MTRKINRNGLDHIMRWEGLRTTAYRDVSGIWTIGYGHTAVAGQPVPVEGMTITAKEAEMLLRNDLEQYESAVAQAVNVTLNDNQFASLVSFSYNVGIDAFLKSRLLERLNQGYFEAVPGELMKWVYSRGRHIRGLANRRAAEAGLWARGDFVSSRHVRPASDGQKACMKPEAAGPVLGAMAGLTSFAAGSGPFQWAFAIVMVMACFIGSWYFIRRMKREMW